VYSVSCTTRPPRGGEQNGHDYFFLSQEEFEQRIKAGDFLEHAIYNGHYYGTPRGSSKNNSPPAKTWCCSTSRCRAPVKVIQRVRAGGFAYPDALVTLFLMPPSIELLEPGCRRRGTDSDETIRKRLALAPKRDGALARLRLCDRQRQARR